MENVQFCVYWQITGYCIDIAFLYGSQLIEGVDDDGGDNVIIVGLSSYDHNYDIHRSIIYKK